MGILDVTPDSFADRGRHFDPAVALEHARALVAAGADTLDVGGESTRPFADAVPLEKELHRVIPIVAGLAPELRHPHLHRHPQGPGGPGRPGGRRRHHQ